MQTALLFLIFNRLDTTALVFEKIRQAKPPRLYIAADGPREDNNDDRNKIVKVREIATKVDWPCEVKTLFRNKNLGCKKAISTAINWFFENEEQGIILEDDCLPNLDFFNFCENLLFRYSKDERISAITGNNFQDGKWRGDASYYFSKYIHCWGWATWRRSWHKYDGNIKFWPKWSNSKDWVNFISNKIERRYWQNIFKRVHLEQVDSWAYPWTASIWYNKGLTITPNVNLVSNIGFGESATHTKSKKDKSFKMSVNNLGTLIYSNKVERNIEADNWTFNHHYGGKNLNFPFSLISYFRKIMIYLFKNKK